MLRLQHSTTGESQRETLLANWPKVDGASVSRFVRQLRRLDITILSPESLHISADERSVLKVLAVSQRQSPGVEIIDPALRLAAEDLGMELRESGTKLPLQAPFAATSVRAGPLIRELSPAADTVELLPARARTGELRARALEMVRRSATVHIRTFLRAGISRQNVSRLCADGLLARAGRDLYRSLSPSSNGE
ncbi:hypothetical protein [Sphingomonas montanisoli]|uniref:Uncharacterized protein n=1 Tax=Sphingomonas montanisoli TaxID=2606412 RepID=A0A5D9C626_9SPHN|nr:hypothetical protein [Sphingomonas montanisoli]TZG27139.1 hypothetical protein FYJ91_05785 [Sphingomonas montanisoli]